MSWKLKLATLGVAAAASVLVAQETPTTTSQSTTQNTQTTQNPDGSTMTTTNSKTTTVTGEVVQYEPGKTIVLRDPNSRTTTYSIDSGLVVPSDVQVGRKVTLYTSPVDGSLRVQRITSVNSTNPDGSSSAKTEVRDEPGMQNQTSSMSQTSMTQSQTAPARPMDPAAADPSMTTTTTKSTKITTVNGTVQAYQPGQSITVVGPGNKTTTYTIVDDSKLPQDVAVGKQVTLQTTIVSGKPVVRSVTSKTTTVKTHTKTVSPQ